MTHRLTSTFWISERALQHPVRDALTAAGFPAEREFRDHRSDGVWVRVLHPAGQGDQVKAIITMVDPHAVSPDKPPTATDAPDKLSP